jgi:hypothetical protein
MDSQNKTEQIDPFLNKLKIACQLSLGLFLVMQVSGGVVRWVLDRIGASVLTYVPNVLMILCVASFASYKILNQRFSQSSFFFILLVGLSLLIGYWNTHNLVQVVFGLWVLVPFLFGITCHPLVLPSSSAQLKWFLLPLFCIAAGGVIANSVLEYPWVGVSYQVGGVEIEGAREWQTSGGAARLSGLARSSFDVAGQVVVFAGVLSMFFNRWWQRIFIWILCGGAVFLSTSKGILLALLMTIIASEAQNSRNGQILRLAIIGGIFWLFVPPLMGWTMDWQELARTDINNPLYGSFLDRMNDMWPKALDLATTHGLPPFGRGLGGIGVPLSIYEPELSNAGDNIFVYMFALIGIIAIPLFVMGFLGLIRMCQFLDDQAIRTTLVLAVIIIWYGGVGNILEHAILALALGFVTHALAVFFGKENLQLAENIDVKIEKE